jgi:glyoxylase-like metal-dependent hydrolase (beta-lactamase superfamily II)
MTFRKKGVQMHEVAEGVFFTEDFSGITLGAVILPRGILFIDAPLRPDDGNSWKAALLNRSSGIIHKILLILDSHPDRTIGAKAMNCSIVAHQDAAEIVHERSAVFRGQIPESGSEWERFPETSGLRWSTPDITFNRRMYFHWGEPDVIMEHHPGPRPGASWVIIPEHKIVFIGDAIVEKSTPFLAQADIPQWIETLKILRDTPFYGFTIISSRGGILDRRILKKQQKNLEKMHKRIEKLARKNAPPEAVADLAEVFIHDYSPEKTRLDNYLQRLRYGLQQYYIHHYLS